MSHLVRTFAVLLSVLLAATGCFEDLRLATDAGESADGGGSGDSTHPGGFGGVDAGFGGTGPDGPRMEVEEDARADRPSAALSPDAQMPASDSARSPDACSEDQKRCGASQTPETCDRAGRWVPAAQPCPNACVGEGLCSGECRPGTRECGGPQKVIPRLCDPSGTWTDAGSPCTKICSGGLCGGDCKPSERKCVDGTTPASCDGAGNWIAQPNCAFVCSGQGQCTGECVPGSGTCSGTVHSTCFPNGTWQADSGTQCKAKTGDSCGTSGDCQSGFCVSGICCNTSCNGTCVSCGVADTGRPNGTCAPISDGRSAPTGQCPEAAQITCGNDGKCDGSGHCRQWGPAVICSDPKCEGGKLAPTGRCGGTGSCERGPATQCPLSLVCRNDACPTSCNLDQDCVSDHYCAKNGCSPRCKASVGNLVPDGGFDSVTGWADSTSARWVAADALGCKSSGSARLEDSGSILSPCFRVSPSAIFTFGAQIKGDDVGSIVCSVQWYTDTGCTVPSSTPYENLDNNAASGRWEPIAKTAITASDATWATVQCIAYPGGAGEVDMIFLKAGSGVEY
jgi:hypothetical protein